MSQLVSTSLESGLDVALHPLPLLSISEQATRAKVQTDKPKRIVGALLGTQTGRNIEITNSFEFALNEETLEVDHTFFTTRRDQFKQVFPTYEVLGWYSTGPQPADEDMRIHQQLFLYNENPLFLQLAPDAHSGKDLPLTIYESATEIVDNNQSTVFIIAPYKVETGEAERVAVDHVNKPSAGSADSAHVTHMIAQRNALQMLHERVLVVQEYLDRLSKGTVPQDRETLRQIHSLVSSLPAADSQEFKTEYMTEYSDVLLTTYLAGMTKELGPFTDMLDRYMLSATSKDRDGPGGGGGGGGGRGRGDDRGFAGFFGGDGGRSKRGFQD